ncbi:MAG: hypothetical protein F6K65_34090, partial [Moorea sp. SIO3C2]|nr:hypothetical protein [Moorena sp. SIO3C2]
STAVAHGGNPRMKALPPQDRTGSPRPRCLPKTVMVRFPHLIIKFATGRTSASLTKGVRLMSMS